MKPILGGSFTTGFCYLVEEKMKMNKNMIKWGLCGIAGLLAVMGLFFIWKCPLDCIYGENSGVFLFKKQLLWYRLPKP